MKVGDLMTTEVATIFPWMNLREAAALMTRGRVGCLVVMEHENLGRHLHRARLGPRCLRGSRPDEARVGEFHSDEVVAITPGTPLKEAASVMIELWLRHLPVLAEDRALMGI